MFATTTYQEALHLDRVQQTHFFMVLGIFVAAIVIGFIIAMVYSYNPWFGLTILFIGSIGSVGTGIYALSTTPPSTMVAQRELPKLNKKVKNLKKQQFKAIDQHKSADTIKKLTNEIYTTQKTINKYNKNVIENKSS